MTIWAYGDSINTDQLFPGKYIYTCSTTEEILPHMLEDLDTEYASNVSEGDIILAGDNFGCGSSREHPVLGFKAVGLKAVVAKSFARIFYRAAINQGLLLIESPEAVEAYNDGDTVEVDAINGTIKVGEQEFSFPPLPAEVLAINEAGGLLPYVRKKLENSQ